MNMNIHVIILLRTHCFFYLFSRNFKLEGTFHGGGSNFRCSLCNDDCKAINDFLIQVYQTVRQITLLRFSGKVIVLT